MEKRKGLHPGWIVFIVAIIIILIVAIGVILLRARTKLRKYDTEVKTPLQKMDSNTENMPGKAGLEEMESNTKDIQEKAPLTEMKSNTENA